MLDGELLLLLAAVGFLMDKLSDETFYLCGWFRLFGLLSKLLWDRWEYSREGGKWKVMVTIRINGC